MKNLGWGDALMAFGIIGGLACIAVGASGSAGPFIGLVLVVGGIFGGGRLVIKGIHRKAADIQARR